MIGARRVKRLETFCAFADFQKAFDYVNHDFLLHKLLDIGIDGKTYKVLKSIYAVSTSCVIVGDRMMDWFSVTSGVRQGDSLSLPSSSQFL